jgi:hypothetical protein
MPEFLYFSKRWHFEDLFRWLWVCLEFQTRFLPTERFTTTNSKSINKRMLKLIVRFCSFMVVLVEWSDRNHCRIFDDITDIRGVVLHHLKSFCRDFQILGFSRFHWIQSTQRKYAKWGKKMSTLYLRSKTDRGSVCVYERDLLWVEIRFSVSSINCGKFCSAPSTSRSICLFSKISNCHFMWRKEKKECWEVTF